MASVNSRSDLTFLSIFSGIGGIDLGLESAGFRSVGCIEQDSFARKSLALNRPGWKLLEPSEVIQASKELTPRALGMRKRQLAVLAGGPPCQPFSKAAQWTPAARKGMRDDRARCLAGFLRLVETFLPRTILIENVPGFVTGSTSAMAVLTTSLERINRKHRTNYRLRHWILNAADYGVPQRRSRAILFAGRKGDGLKHPSPTHSSERITAWDAIGDFAVKGQPQITRGDWLDLLPTIPEGQNYLWHTSHGGGKPLFGYRTRFWSFLLKLAKDQTAWTLSANPGPFTGPFHWDNRPLTTEEMLRLQSFPSTWQVTGSRREQIRQVGNATPPLLIEIIGRSIKNEIFGYKSRSAPRLAITRSKRQVPNQIAMLPVPRSFLTLIGDWPDHPGTGKGPQPVLITRGTHGKKPIKATNHERRYKKAGRKTRRDA